MQMKGTKLLKGKCKERTFNIKLNLLHHFMCVAIAKYQ